MGNENSIMIDDFVLKAKQDDIPSWYNGLNPKEQNLIDAFLNNLGFVRKVAKGSSNPNEKHQTPKWPDRNQVQHWLEKLDQFWDNRWEKLELEDKESPSIQVLARIYTRSASTELDVKTRLIQRRHIQLFWYQFIINVFPTAKGGSRQRIDKSLCQYVANKLHPYTEDTLEKVTTQLFADATAGKKYDELCKQFCLGILVVLPEELEKHAIIHGTRYSLETCVSGIRDQRLVDHASEIGADSLSSRIMASLNNHADPAIKWLTATPNDIESVIVAPASKRGKIEAKAGKKTQRPGASRKRKRKRREDNQNKEPQTEAVEGVLSRPGSTVQGHSETGTHHAEISFQPVLESAFIARDAGAIEGLSQTSSHSNEAAEAAPQQAPSVGLFPTTSEPDAIIDARTTDAEFNQPEEAFALSNVAILYQGTPGLNQNEEAFALSDVAILYQGTSEPVTDAFPASVAEFDDYEEAFALSDAAILYQNTPGFNQNDETFALSDVAMFSGQQPDFLAQHSQPFPSDTSFNTRGIELSYDAHSLRHSRSLPFPTDAGFNIEREASAQLSQSFNRQCLGIGSSH